MAIPDSVFRQDALIGGKYQLGPVIGSGGVATVYRATHVLTEREVAVKVLDPTLPHFDQLREAFLREARTTVQLNHPNVVDVLDMGDDECETAFLVMELLQGPTLRDVLLEQGPLSPDDTLTILLPVIDALEKAHELGIVHRDFKPENIMLSLDAYGVMTPKLLDFGIAEILQDLRSRNAARTNAVAMGTPQYMSPEQARDDRALFGPHTDVWGVGVVWYECLTGHSPFDGERATEVLWAVCEAPIEFENVPEVYVPLLRDALKRQPEERIGTLSELKARIEDMGLATFETLPSHTPLSSWTSLGTRDSHLQRTLLGLGPTAGSDRIDSEPIPLPSSSNTKTALAAVAIGLGIAGAAWWTLTMRGASNEPTAPNEPVTVEAEAAQAAAPSAEPNPPEKSAPEPAPEEAEAAAPSAEPTPPPTSALPPAPEEAPPADTTPPIAEETAPETTPAVDPEPTEQAESVQGSPDTADVAAETEPKVSRRPRRKAPRKAARGPGRSSGQQYQKLPDLVTEW